MRVVLVAQESAGVQALRALHGMGQDVVAVLTSPPEPDAAPRGATVAGVARRLGDEVWPAELVKDPQLAARIRDADVDLLLNVHSLHVVHPAVLDAPRIGAFNLHPGPLPRYAGLNAPSWAIYRGERTHGVTLHWMRAGIDTGPIAYARPLEIAANETGLSLFMKCVRVGVPMLRELVATAEEDPRRIPRIPQDRGQRTYFGRRVPQNGVLDWTRPAHEIDAFVRACDYVPFRSPWGHPATGLAGERVEVVKVSATGDACTEPPGALTTRDERVLAATGDAWLAVERVRLGGVVRSALDVLRDGARFVDPPHEAAVGDDA